MNKKALIAKLDRKKAPCYYEMMNLYARLIIEDEAKAHQLIFDILRKTGCSIKEEYGKHIIYKKKSKIDKEYDVYIEAKK